MCNVFLEVPTLQQSTEFGVNGGCTLFDGDDEGQGTWVDHDSPFHGISMTLKGISKTLRGIKECAFYCPLLNAECW